MPGQMAETVGEQVTWKPTGDLLVIGYLLREQNQLARRGNGMKETIGLLRMTAGP